MNCIDVQPDGKFITAGHTNSGSFSDVFLINQYNNDGSKDKTFGSDGTVSTSFGEGRSYPYAIKILPEGKFLVAGVYASSAVGLHSQMVIARYNSNGSLDKTFGTEGKSLIDFNEKSGVATNLLLQKDGKVILTGYAADCYGCSNGDLALAKLNDDGILDSSFGIDGKQRNNFASEFESSKTSILQKDNKILVIGTDEVSGDIILARYNNHIDKKQIIITKIKHWLQQHQGFIWYNNSAINNYVVQRSYDGVHFTSVTKINSNNNFIYTYNDPAPLNGSNYYRLQTTSNSGSVNYSNIIAITNSDIKISPNPAKNVLQVKGLPSNQKIKITVIDFTGDEKLQVIIRNTSYNLKINSLKAGNYLLKIEMNEDVFTKKFIKE